ncbi:tetratricopeptide repeat protein [Borreliella yangtzensis]|uniref:tetratricopeptide repeat protein n=1 Tax=Borreliella yangtzensis TaxID=683292 RepID=UPI002648E32A|nr:tetratricopeptide repeat protein [Borreliella yangtzensis]WKC75263.1 tetratricopeptide repeat protein [Borreliella yangtzensis]
MNNFSFEKALNFYKNGDFKSSLDNLDVFDENFDSLSLKALIYFKKKDYKALSYLLNTYPVVLSEYNFLVKLVDYGKVEKNKDDLSPFENYNLGVFYFNLKEYELALSCFLKAKEQKSDFIQALNNSAVLFEMLGNKDKALKLFFEARNLDQNNSLVKLNIWILKNIKSLEIVSFLKVEEIFFDANLALVVNYLMYYFYSIGEISRAIRLSEKFLTDSYYSKYIWHNRATIFHKMGNMTQATSSYVKAILNFPNIYTIYNMHIATIELLKFSPKKSIERMVNDYSNLNLIYLYATLFFLRNRELEDAYFYMKKLCELNPEPYLKFLKLLEFSEDMLIENLLEEFAISLRVNWHLEYLFFIDNSLNLRDPIFIFDHNIRVNTYIWRIKDECIELKFSNNEEKMVKEVLHEECIYPKVDISIGDFQNLIEAYKEFRMNY